MKIIIARKDLKCTFCKMTIQKGDFCIRTSFKDRIDRSKWVFTFFHEECCKQQTYKNQTDFINNQKVLLRDKIEAKKKSKKSVGKPRKYSDPLLARNITSLLYHHRKLGHTDKVAGLELKLKEIRVG